MWLVFPKGIAGMDSLDKPVEQISFRKRVTFCEHGQLKGWQPHFQPTAVKSSISTSVHVFAAVTSHNWEDNQYPVIQILDTITVLHVTNLGDHNSVTKPSASLHETGYSCSCNKGMSMMQAQCRAGGAYCGSQEPQASGREWMLGIPKRNGRNGFLTCPTNLLSAVRHI